MDPDQEDAEAHPQHPSSSQQPAQDLLGSNPDSSGPSTSEPAQEGLRLAETDNLVTELSLAPLAVQSSYTPFQGRHLCCARIHEHTKSSAWEGEESMAQLLNAT